MSSSNAQEQGALARRARAALLLRLKGGVVSALLGGWMGLIFYLSSLEAAAVPDALSQLGWVREVGVHAVLYTVLGGLALLTLWVWIVRPDRRLLWAGAAMAFGMLHGVLDEVHQSFVPGRSASPFDLLIDALASVVGVLAVRRLARPHRPLSSFVSRQ